MGKYLPKVNTERTFYSSRSSRREFSLYDCKGMNEEYIYTVTTNGNLQRHVSMFDAFNASCTNVFVYAIRYIKGETHKVWLRKIKWNSWGEEIEKRLNQDKTYRNSCIVWIEQTVINCKKYAAIEIALATADKFKRKQIDMLKFFMPTDVVRWKVLTIDNMEDMVTEDELYSERSNPLSSNLIPSTHRQS